MRLYSILTIFVLIFSLMTCGATVIQTEKELEAEPKIKMWKMPEYMKENLQFMTEEFNRKFQQKIENYKKELKARFPEFKGMPEDVLFDFQSGVFLRREDYLKLQKEAAAKIEAQRKKDAEVKKNEKENN